MAISKTNYQRATKHAITVGRKGEKQKRYTYKKIASKIRKVEKRAKEYSQKYYGKNAEFPRNLGVGQRNIFTRKVKDLLLKVEQGTKKDLSLEELKSIEKVFSMASDIKSFREFYFKEVARHYGVEDKTRFEVKSLLEKGKLNVSYETKTNKLWGGENPLLYTVSDTKSLAEWIIKNVDGAEKIEDIILEVQNVNYLRKVVDEWNLYRDTSFIDELKKVFDYDSSAEDNSNV